MELFFVSLLCSFVLLVLLSLHFLFYKNKGANLPPGSTGWPFIGESLDFLSANRSGHPEKFIFDRMTKYSPQIFRTSLLGNKAVVFCGASGNKFLFSNENKHVQMWWPGTVDKIFHPAKKMSSNMSSLNMKRTFPDFFKPKTLQRYVGLMDDIAVHHFASCWENKKEVVTLDLAKNFTFRLACRVFMSVDDPDYVAKLSDQFDLLAPGLISLPIDFPGTPFNRAIKASSCIRKEIMSIIKQRKIDLAEEKASPIQDIMSHMLLASDENGKFFADADVAEIILGLLVGAHDPASSTCSFVVKYLAELPEVYERVYKEQMEIAKTKAPGELLNWDDTQNMKYSWNVACEVLRLAPPVQGAFREAINDFMFNGFKIPKGWKNFTGVQTRHIEILMFFRDVFPEPLKFDPSRFEGSGPAPSTFVPFGGGPRMCPGREFARVQILVFMHHLVRRFRWEKIIPDEKIVMDPIPLPSQGLPIRLYPHKA